MSKQMSNVRSSRRFLLPLFACPMALFLSSLVNAQSTLEVVESNVGDSGPLSRSFRNLSMDLRQPTSFERLYRFQGDREYYMRSNGGLHAVFPRSVYSRTRRGSAQARIPDGTVFYIGTPPSFGESLDERPVHHNENMVENRREVGSAPISFDARASMPGSSRLHPSPRRSSTPQPTTMCTDATYRSRRLHALMRQAARSAKQVG